jgi:cellulose synthase/poly-beta-1,6-N-acetylglucosamine synthase-like glycosyltransferase
MSVLLICFIIFLFVIWLILSSAGLNGLMPKKDEAKPTQRKKLKILLMVPCKGTDIELERNLTNATKQDYPNYKAVAIVEGKDDPAFKSIKASGIDYILADPKYDACSGKVKNLSTALAKFKGYDAYCIMDSDVNTQKGWLSSLAASMDEKTGIATAFPIFNPVDGGFWSKAKHIWGFVGFGLMENPETRFGWGGTLLFRKEILGDGGFELFSRSVSDDITLTNLCKNRGYSIAYAPEALPVVDCKENAHSFLEWSNRQTAFSVLGNRRHLYVGLVYYSASVLLLVSAILLSLFYNHYLVILFLPFVLFVARNYQRSGGSDPLIIPISLVLTFLFLYNIANSAFMRRVEWRGRTYRLRS